MHHFLSWVSKNIYLNYNLLNHCAHHNKKPCTSCQEMNIIIASAWKLLFCTGSFNFCNLDVLLHEKLHHIIISQLDYAQNN